MAEHKFPYEWYLKDGYPAKSIEYHGKKVFGTFICGGGSSMGYKLAGYEHLGGVEIDPKIAKIYQVNHNPKHLYIEDIREFNKRDDLPDELYDLDFLDGSPPCSSFSTAGNRDKDWNKKKVFAEGQAEQRLDDLVFEYVDTIKKLHPKVALLENVSGLIQGNAKAYAREINKQFTNAGYRVQLFLLNAASMGVPQKRERVFFVGLRNDFDLGKLGLSFDENLIPFKAVSNNDNQKCNLSEQYIEYWNNAKQGESVGKFLTKRKQKDTDAAYTIDATNGKFHPRFPRTLDDLEHKRIGTYPLDYDFLNIKPLFLIGMSVPPVMTAQISHQIYLQWLSKI